MPPQPRRSVSPHLFLAASALLWAGHHVVTRSVRDEFTPATLAFWRWSVALLVLAALAGGGLYRKRASLRGRWLTMFFFGITGTGLYNIFTYAGIQLTTATNAVMIHALTPAVIPLAAWILFRERIHPRAALGIAISFLGVVAIGTRLDPEVAAALSVNRGDLWILGSAVMWALYTVCLRLKPPELTQLEFLLVISAAGLVPLTPLFLLDLAAGASLPPTPVMVAVVLYLSVLLSVVTYALWSMGVHAIGSTQAGLYMNGIPVLGIGMAIVFLSERPQLYHGVGFVLIVLGIWLAAPTRARR